MCLNEKKTIAIKCSGSLSLGMGHIMRTMVIAEELKKTCDVFYISKSDFEYQSGVEKIKDLGFDVYYDEDEISADFLIFDSYDDPSGGTGHAGRSQETACWTDRSVSAGTPQTGARQQSAGTFRSLCRARFPPERPGAGSPPAKGIRRGFARM